LDGSREYEVKMKELHLCLKDEWNATWWYLVPFIIAFAFAFAFAAAQKWL
jgi:hypothetical protein